MLIFPEGTRSSNGELKDYKKGRLVLALQAQVPIIAVGISARRSIIPRGEWGFKVGSLGVSVGEPISTKGMTAADRETFMRDVRDSLLHEKERASS